MDNKLCGKLLVITNLNERRCYRTVLVLNSLVCWGQLFMVRFVFITVWNWSVELN
jgi:hypothetical protein